MWKPIEDFVYPATKDIFAETGSFIVWNGQRCGEAKADLRTDWDSDDDQPTEDWQWAWTHHSTCSCCFELMDPQPTWFQPMPNPPA